MKLYNTLTKQVEEIEPLNTPEVTIYTCGPTVYDYPHIGNWFTFIRYDLLVRTLKAGELKSKWVMNITDVGHLVSDADEGEDKLEKGARREGKTAWDVAKFYGDYFTNGLERLNFSQPDYLPKATEHIPEQIELIQKLEAKGYTYTIDDGVYYDTSKFEGYTAFARLDLDQQRGSGRVETNSQKRSPSDFALWKLSPKDHKRDMEWDSPWGTGFPGWHIECSAMAAKYLGETIDIHAGGIDHVPVHHTNEIAQSEATTGQRFANYWMHANHILINDEKIAKSAGNGITLEEIEAKGCSLEALRLHVFESHYRSQSKFSWESLEAAGNRLKSWQAFADLRFQGQSIYEADGKRGFFQEKMEQVKAALEDDLNTPEALRIISEAIDQLEKSWADLRDDDLGVLLDYLDKTLGLRLLESENITEDQQNILIERQNVRDDKDWAKSDELRDKLQEQGIGVRDTDTGQIWFRV